MLPDSTCDNPTEVLVIGIGNAFRGDDSAGLSVLRALAGSEPGGSALAECHGDVAELMWLWKGRKKVILVEAMRTGALPGTISRVVLPDELVPNGLSEASLTGLRAWEAIDSVQRVGEIPETLVVFGIEGRRFTFGSDVSEEVRRNIPRLAGMVLKEIELLLSLQAA